MFFLVFKMAAIGLSYIQTKNVFYLGTTTLGEEGGRYPQNCSTCSTEIW